MKAVNIERDEEVTKAAVMISKYCNDHDNCSGCTFSFSQVCLLKWTKPDGWYQSLSKVTERRKKNAVAKR